MARKKTARKSASARPTPIKAGVDPANPAPNPLAATPEQIAAAQEQARQRMLLEYNVLKQKFADESIARTIAETQNQQLIERLTAAQQTIEKLTESNRQLQKAAGPKDATPEPEPNEPGDPEDKHGPEE